MQRTIVRDEDVAPQVFTIHKIRLLPNTVWFLQKMPSKLVSILFFFQNNEFLKMFLTISSCGMGNGYELVMETCSFR